MKSDKAEKLTLQYTAMRVLENCEEYVLTEYSLQGIGIYLASNKEPLYIHIDRDRDLKTPSLSAKASKIDALAHKAFYRRIHDGFIEFKNGLRDISGT